MKTCGNVCRTQGERVAAPPGLLGFQGILLPRDYCEERGGWHIGGLALQCGQTLSKHGRGAAASGTVFVSLPCPVLADSQAWHPVVHLSFKLELTLTTWVRDWATLVLCREQEEVRKK